MTKQPTKIKRAATKVARKPVAKRRVKPAAKPRPTPTRGAAKRRAKPAKTRAAAKSAAKPRAKPASRRAASKVPRKAAGSKWLAFVAEHGVVLASAKGPVPSVAEAIAGEPIVGSWWSHPRGQVIFDALSEIDDDVDVRCFKLIDGKVTFVHRRLWPALVRLAREGRLAADRVASIQQEHMPTGEHRNLVTPFPDWVPDEVGAAAASMSVEQARAQLGSWA
ncbi:MAG: hypothetical protein IPQ07_28700 [Myxococcales bacterium]|nr:hypothetical protein [Myxococcales bacterium]